jgi:hypothetical protein
VSVHLRELLETRLHLTRVWSGRSKLLDALVTTRYRTD